MMIKRYSNYLLYFFPWLMVLFATSSFTLAAGARDNVNFAEIIEYAHFADAAYKNDASIREHSALKNYHLTRYSIIPAFEISYYLLTDDVSKTQIIAVRGTSNMENAMLDVAFNFVTDKRAGIRLHDGFSQTATAIYSEIQAQLKKDYMISTTGHSLGGAVALILAMYLDVDKYKIGQVVTFGQPKVTNITGANTFEHLNVTRVVTPKDLVPLVPPLDPADLTSMDIYWHLGREVVLLADNTYAVLTGVNSMLRATRFTKEPLNESNINNHQMPLYLNLLSKKIPTAKLVPYRNDFNLFNLFGTE